MESQNNEIYEVLYKKLMAHLGKESISLPAFVIKQEKPEKWVEEEESSNVEEPKGKCLMVHINEFLIEKYESSSITFDTNISF